MTSMMAYYSSSMLYTSKCLTRRGVGFRNSRVNVRFKTDDTKSATNLPYKLKGHRDIVMSNKKQPTATTQEQKKKGPITHPSRLYRRRQQQKMMKKKVTATSSLSSQEQSIKQGEQIAQNIIKKATNRYSKLSHPPPIPLIPPPPPMKQGFQRYLIPGLAITMFGLLGYFFFIYEDPLEDDQYWSQLLDDDDNEEEEQSTEQ